MTKTVKFGLAFLFLAAIISPLGFPIKGPSSFIFITIGIVLICLAIYFLFFLSRRNIQNLKEHGVKVQAKIKYIQAEVSMAGNASTLTFKFICEGKNITSGVLEEYISNAMFIQPDIHIDANSLLDVYINPKNEKDYWVDISKIPVKTNTYAADYHAMFPGPYNPVKFNYFRSYDGVNYQIAEEP